MVGIFRYTVGGDYDASSSSEIYVGAGITLESLVGSTTQTNMTQIQGKILASSLTFSGFLTTSTGVPLKVTENGFYFDYSGELGNIEFTGGSFADVFIAGRYGHTVHGGNGDDLIINARGGRQDVLYGGAGKDTTSYIDLTTGVYVNLKTGTASRGNTSNDRLFDFENIQGSRWADTLIGDDGDNVLHDGGQGGHDQLTGGLGNDTYCVYNYYDRIIEHDNGGRDRVAIGESYVLSDGASIEYFNTTSVHGTRSINLTGNEFDQLIRGNDGSNIIDGKGGSDIIFGMEGADTFVFSHSGGMPTIMDFDVREDWIALDHEIFTELSVGPLAISMFKDMSLDTRDADDRIFYNPASGSLFYDTDGTGRDAPIKIATLGTGLALTAADFLVI